MDPSSLHTLDHPLIHSLTMSTPAGYIVTTHHSEYNNPYRKNRTKFFVACGPIKAPQLDADW